MAYQRVTESCGYQGHVCSNSVQFISRYRDKNDYCLRGQRISVHDDGTVHSSPAPTPEQLQAIRLYEIQKYADYVKWHVAQIQKLAESTVESLADNRQSVEDFLRAFLAEARFQAARAAKEADDYTTEELEYWAQVAYDAKPAQPTREVQS